MKFEEVSKNDQNYVMNTYGRFPVVLESGKGATAAGCDGKTYLDFGSGIGVNSLGYCNDGWCKAVEAQLHTLQHTSNLYYTNPCVTLAEKLCKATGMSRVFFGNSGAEANEGAIKVARKYSFDKYGENRAEIITLKNSFHGRTVTTLAATGQDHFHESFMPFTGGFVYAPLNDMKALKETVTKNTCAIMIELVQGEGGVFEADKGFVKELEAYCQENDLLLIVDEVQTGVGRCGTFLASQLYDIKPNVVSLAKGLGGGLPIGAVLVDEKTKDVLGAGDHGSTFGGNPVVCAGANYVMDTVANEDFLAEVNKKADYMKENLLAMNEVDYISGQGFMIGIALKTKKAGDMAKKALENGLLVLTAKDKIRLLPPLTISYEEMDKGLAILQTILN